MQHVSIKVRAEWDEDAKVWVASSDDVSGLSVEASTMEELEPKVRAALTDLVELNGTDSCLAEIPFHIMSEQLSKIPNPCV